MTTIIRVKRHRLEDPVEALVLSCKRKKTQDSDSNLFQKVLNFSGTVEQKDDKVAASTVESFQKDSKYTTFQKNHIPEIRAKQRQEKKERREDNRFLLLSCLRSGNRAENSEVDPSADVKENITIVDVSKETNEEVTEHGATEVSYVYDLYSVQDKDSDFSDIYMENLLSVQPLSSELDYWNAEDEEIDPDEDDSNDENNWRNDYPDTESRLELWESSLEESDEESSKSCSDNEVIEILSSDSEEGERSNYEAFEGHTCPLADEEAEIFFSKNGKEMWSSKPVSSVEGRRSKKDVKEQFGTSRFARNKIVDLQSAFLLFFRASLLEKIVKWTNEEGQMRYKQKWVNTSLQELKRLLGVLILIGVYKSKNEEVSQLWSKIDGRPIFNNLMPRNRFKRLIGILRFDDAAALLKQRSCNKTEPIDDIIQEWNKYLGEAYNPGRSLTVGEQVVTFRGLCPLKQYLPSKPGKSGIKFWALCDSETSYCLKLMIYKGRETGEVGAVNVGERVLKNLVSEYLNTGRNITCAHFFTNIRLARFLLSKNTTVVGTMRKSTAELPPEFASGKRLVGSSIFGFQPDVTIVSYVSRKNNTVTLLSTLHHDDKVDERKQPEIVSSYIATKGGVDRMDQMAKCYSVKGKTRRWPLAVFYNMIDISAFNAYILWVSISGKNKLSIRKFLIQLGKELGDMTSEPSEQELEVATVAASTTKKRCHFCPRSKDRKHKTHCFRCQMTVCPGHSEIFCKRCSKTV